jgi:hypothetical protein
MRPNPGAQDSRLDLELMFGLATTDPAQLRELLRTEAA